MVVKMTNQTENFYHYMGKFFGSRLVERQTNDRIYDDDNKQWYLYLEQGKVKAFVSISKNIIKHYLSTANAVSGKDNPFVGINSIKTISNSSLFLILA